MTTGVEVDPSAAVLVARDPGEGHLEGAADDPGDLPGGDQQQRIGAGVQPQLERAEEAADQHVVAVADEVVDDHGAVERSGEPPEIAQGGPAEGARGQPAAGQEGAHRRHGGEGDGRGHQRPDAVMGEGGQQPDEDPARRCGHVDHGEPVHLQRAHQQGPGDGGQPLEHQATAQGHQGSPHRRVVEQPGQGQGQRDHRACHGGAHQELQPERRALVRPGHLAALGDGGGQPGVGEGGRQPCHGDREGHDAELRRADEPDDHQGAGERDGLGDGGPHPGPRDGLDGGGADAGGRVGRGLGRSCLHG